MRVAVTYENGEVYGHFGRTPQFKMYNIEDGAVGCLHGAGKADARLLLHKPG